MLKKRERKQKKTSGTQAIAHHLHVQTDAQPAISSQTELLPGSSAHKPGIN